MCPLRVSDESALLSNSRFPRVKSLLYTYHTAIPHYWRDPLQFVSSIFYFLHQSIALKLTFYQGLTIYSFAPCVWFPNKVANLTVERQQIAIKAKKVWLRLKNKFGLTHGLIKKPDCDKLPLIVRWRLKISFKVKFIQLGIGFH